MPSSYVIPVTEAPPGERVAFVSIVNFFLRNVAWFVVGGVIFAVLLALPSLSGAPRYTASTSFIIEGEPNVGRFMGFGGGGGRGSDYYMALMKTPLFLEPLVETPIEIEPGKGTRTLVDIYGSGSTPQERRENAMVAVAERMTTKSSEIGVVTLNVRAENPRLAAAIAQTTIEQIHAFINDRRRLQTSAERQFIEQRMVEVGAEVRAAEDRLQAFLERNRDVGRSPALAIERDRITEFLSAKRGLYSSILQAHEKARIDEVREAPKATVISRPLPPLQPDPRHVMRNAILGFFAGVMFAAIAAFIKEQFARIPGQATPEAAEYAALRATMGQRLRRPIERVMSLRKSRGSDGKANL